MVLATKIIVGGAAPFARVSLGGGGALIMWRQHAQESMRDDTNPLDSIPVSPA